MDEKILYNRLVNKMKDVCSNKALARILSAGLLGTLLNYFSSSIVFVSKKKYDGE